MREGRESERRCLLLNACELGARSPDRDRFTGLGASSAQTGHGAECAVLGIAGTTGAVKTHMFMVTR